MTIPAAGILITTPAKEALFLLRGNGSDFPNTWCLPGGKIEAGETALEAAKRETVEEIGSLPKGKITELCRSTAISTGISPDGENGEVVDFTTFLAKVEDKFDIVTSGEHVGFAWAPLDRPPEPLHPGVRIALDRIGMTELDAARAIADGRLTSPHKFTDNLALFAMRISGTGLAYRIGLDEYAWRSPEEYLSEEMQARWLGAPVVWEHPDGDTLTSKDFNKTSIGAVMLTFVKGDELWGVARIYDAAAIQIMGEGGMSTSPGVVLRTNASTTMKLEDGSNLLVEGVPFLCDHLAVCNLGVWDKGGPATGVAAQARKDSAMADNTEAELKARKDAEDEKAAQDKARKDADEAISKIADAVGTLAKRFDAWEEEKKADKADKARKDAEEAEAAEAKAKKDAEDKEAEEKAKADKAKKDAEEAEAADKAKKDAQAAALNEDVLARLARVEASVKPISDEDRARLADIQARFDSVFIAFGKSAPRALDGETPLGYRRRLLTSLQSYSPDFKDASLAGIQDSVSFDVAERIILKDAVAAAKSPSDLAEGELRKIVKPDLAGRQVVEWVGKECFTKQFSADGVWRGTGKITARN